MDNITEAAQALADEYHINIETLEGSGSDGKILKADVEAAIPPVNIDYLQRGPWYDCEHCSWNTTHEQQMKDHIRAKHRS